MRIGVSALRRLVSEARRIAYELLGVRPDASPAEIKRAFRAKSLALHPDHAGNADTTRDMAALNVAYDLLSDPEKRSRYDRTGDYTLGDKAGAAPPPPPAQRRASTAAPPRASLGKRSVYMTNAETDEFCEIVRKDRVVYVTRGRIGTMGRQQPPYRAQTVASADLFFNKVMFEMVRQGFKADTSGPASSRAKASSPPPDARDTKRTRYMVHPSGVYVELFQDGTSLEVTLWNPNGTLKGGQARRFSSPDELAEYVDHFMGVRAAEGFVESDGPPGKQKAGGDAEKKRPAVKKDTYKVYGRKGTFPVHTRYKGKVYGAAADTKFKAGQQAAIEPDGDDLRVRDPETGHTQSWKREAARQCVAAMTLLEMTRWC